MLLVHPPNSSSAVTLGCVTRPPEAPGTIAVLAKELPMPDPPLLLPHAPKSLDGCATGCGVAAGLLAGAGSAHALPPHTSAPENPPLAPIVASGLVVAAGAGGDLGCERLKTELDELDTAGAGAGVGAGAAAGAGAEKSNRSFIADDAGAAALGWAAGEEKSPNPPKPPKPLFDGAGLLAGVGAAGLESKKLPPPRPENADDCCGWGVDLLLETGFKFENAEFWGLFGLDMFEKLKLLKASFNPPPDGWLTCWVICGGPVGDAKLPKEPE